MSIFSWKGDGHNLSKGAFDSVSVGKPGTASLLLAEHMAKPYKDTYDLLATPYQFNLSMMQPTAATSLWRDYLKPGLKKAGFILWEVAKPVAMEVVAGLAGINPTLAALVGASEAVLSAYLQGYGEEVLESKSLVLNKGQWLFIESADNRRRRLKGLMKGQKEVKGVVRKRVEDKTIQNVVHFGFYVGAGHDPNKVNVFNMDTGKAEHVCIQRIRDAPANLQEKADSDENLSVLRELYFYKMQGDEFQKAHPKDAIFPGRQVEYNGTDYTLIQRNDASALLEDEHGNTQVVDVDKLRRGVGKSTPGHTDDFFNKSGSGAFYAGQWCMVPARSWVRERWSTDMELAVVYQVDKNKELEVALCLDGEMVYHHEDNCQVFPPDMQQHYSAKQPFKLFKQAAVKGYQADTKRYELGSVYAQICVLDYSHTLTYLGSDDKEDMKDYLTVTKEVDKVGNTEKKLVDVLEEAHKKGLTDMEITDVIDRDYALYDDPDETLDSEGGDGMLLGLIAVGALLLISLGGAAAA